MSGDLYTAYKNTAYLQQVRNNIWWNSWFLNQSFFPVIGEGECPGGSTIPFLIDYSTSTNAEQRVIGTPIPNPDTINTVAAYFNKDYYHASSKVAGITKQQLTVNHNGSVVPIDPNMKSMQTASKNLVDLISTTIIADLITQVDSATAFSDASLTRATYGIEAYESAVSGVQTLALFEDGIEYLEDVTYGPIAHEDLVIIMARNQKTNHARLVTGAAYRETNSSSESKSAIDGGTVNRVMSFDDVPFLILPDFTNTTILIVPKSAIKVYVHENLRFVKKDLDEDAEADYALMGVNIIMDNPRCGVKYTSVTA
jgi:hypothetical protein